MNKRDTAELKALDDLVDEFAKEMKEKLHRKFYQRWTGWRAKYNKEEFEKKLFHHAVEGQMVDTANFAAFIWKIKGGRDYD